VADLERIGVAETGGGEVGVLNPEDGQIRAWIPPDESRRHRAPLAINNGQVFNGSHRVVGRHDDPGTPVNTRRRQARARIHGDDAPGHLLHGGRQFVGK